MESDEAEAGLSRNDLLRLSADIVIAFVGRNPVGVDAPPAMLVRVYETLSRLEADPAPHAAAARPKPAVPIARSVQHDHIVCLEDGRRLKMLKRYLRSQFGMSPEEYRRKWGLPPEYPMVAPAYAERRSAFAKEFGLGRGIRRRRD